MKSSRRVKHSCHTACVYLVWLFLRITTMCNLSVFGFVHGKLFAHARTVDTRPLFPPTTWPGYEASWGVFWEYVGGIVGGVYCGYPGGILWVCWGYTGGTLEYVGGILGVYWGYAGGILGLCWGYAGGTLGVSRGVLRERYTGGILGVYWGYAGGILGVCWGYTVGMLGGILGASWGYTGGILGVYSWGYTGSILGVYSWGYAVGMLGVCWSMLGCTDLVQREESFSEST